MLYLELFATGGKIRCETRENKESLLPDQPGSTQRSVPFSLYTVSHFPDNKLSINNQVVQCYSMNNSQTSTGLRWPKTMNSTIQKIGGCRAGSDRVETSRFLSF